MILRPVSLNKVRCRSFFDRSGQEDRSRVPILADEDVIMNGDAKRLRKSPSRSLGRHRAMGLIRRRQA
jgi:hypothetical protein